MAEMDFETAGEADLLVWWLDRHGMLATGSSLAKFRSEVWAECTAKVEARLRAETVDREREAARKAWQAGYITGLGYPEGSFITASLPALEARDRYLAREYPAPAPSAVKLSDGSVVTRSQVRGFFAVIGSDRIRGSDVAAQDWRDLAITGADFDALKAFAATVEGR